MNLNPIINNFQRPIRKVQICCILIFSCAACSLNIPYENQYSDPDAITTVTAARELLASAYDAIPQTGIQFIRIERRLPAYFFNKLECRPE